ncbi:type VI secretion system baseplate subunit TssF [Luteolibacter sp. Populi]|uniref:type VI secretion system baseplate subunit TssF n=1 Tax=Luteolibacter sp. Populi TaxID=3230487 RepID=UPI003466E06D
MNERFLGLYDVELQHLRRLAGEFARHRPQTGKQLGIDVDGRQLCQDPFVERLLEGFAFLAARVHYQLDAEFPRFTQGLLETVYPDYLAPLPSAGVVRFNVDPSIVFERVEIPAGGEVVTEPFGPRATRCRWQTTQDLTLLPIRIADVSYRSGHGSIATAHEAAMSIKLELLHPSMSWEELGCDKLRFFVPGAEQSRLRLLAHVIARNRGVWLGGKNGARQISGANLKQLGFGEGERLLPMNPAGFEGYRLLREYFLLPEKFHFFEINGLKEAFAGAVGREIELVIPFSEDDSSLQAVVGRKSLELFAVPIVNLFPMSRRFDFDPRRPEHHVTMDRARTHDFEVYSIEGATGHGTKSGDDTSFRPFFFNQADGDEDRAFYMVRRDSFPRPTKGVVLPHLGYPGSEVYLSLVDLKAAPFKLDIRQIGVEARCTNRHLPLLMIEQGAPVFSYPESELVHSIEFLSGPTPPAASNAEGPHAWRLISHLSLNYQSLIGADGDAAALRELLALYADKSRREIGSLRSVRSETRQALHRFEGGPPSFVRGLEITLGFDQNVMSAPEVLLFSRVLEEFFGRYASMNCFTQTSVSLLPGKNELVRWPRRIGKTCLI